MNGANKEPEGDAGRVPFNLADNETYRRWRDTKLAAYPSGAADLVVEIADLANPTQAEADAILERCRRANMAVYACAGRCLDEHDVRPDLAALTARFGLRRAEDHRSAAPDGIVAIEVATKGGRHGFIPYTTRPIRWHTDGYYNYHGPADCIRAMVLHCVRDAGSGGENRLLDHDIAYIRLRDENPDYIAALMHAQAMTIPQSVEENGRVRAENTGPVFAVDPASGTLTMRYTARKRNIRWRDDAMTGKALAFLADVMENDPLVIKAHLAPGQGVLCNNVLHDRSGFANTQGEPGRLYYRARYFDRIASTGLPQGRETT